MSIKFGKAFRKLGGGMSLSAIDPLNIKGRFH